MNEAEEGSLPARGGFRDKKSEKALVGVLVLLTMRLFEPELPAQGGKRNACELAKTLYSATACRSRSLSERGGKFGLQE